MQVLDLNHLLQLLAIIQNANTNLLHPFASHLNFLDRQYNSKGEPYGPIRFKQIVTELYVISKNLNTSYTDLLQISPLERGYLLDLMQEERRQQQEALEKARMEREANKNK